MTTKDFDMAMLRVMVYIREGRRNINIKRIRGDWIVSGTNG